MQNMKRLYLNFRPTAEQLEEINSIGQQEGLTNAHVVRQLFIKGLDEYHKGRLEFKSPGASQRNKGGPDRRHLRPCGQKIRRSKKKSGDVAVGDASTARPDTPLKGVRSNE